MNRSSFPMLMVAVAGAAAMTVGLATAQGRFDREDRRPAEEIRIFEGVSDRGNFQDALDRAVARAQRSLPGADRMVRYKVRDITGEQGGIRGGNLLSVTIEVSDEDARLSRPDDPDFRPDGPDRPDDPDRGDAPTVLRDSLRPELRLASDEVARGETAVFELTVRNTSNQTVRVPFNSGQQYNFEVWRDNRLIWSWAEGRAFTQALATLTLRPDQSVTFTARWNGLNNAGTRVSPGEYQVRAYLPTGIRDFRVGDSATLTVR